MAVNEFYDILKSVLAKREVELFQFYPDVIPYQYEDEAEFKAHWDKLTRLRRTYLYVKQNEIKRVSAVRYGWEWFKGKLGFTNHCNKLHTQMALQKLAYYGYANNFFENSSVPRSNLLPNNFQRMLQAPNSKENLFNLQQFLIDFYNARKKNLRPAFWKRLFTKTNDNSLPSEDIQHYFGDTLVYILNLVQNPRRSYPHDPNESIVLILKMLATLYPQDENFYQTHYSFFKYISPEMINRGLSKNPLIRAVIASEIMKNANSVFNTSLSIFDYMKKFFSPREEESWIEWKNSLDQASHYDPTVVTANKEMLIQYYLCFKKYSEAFDLIKSLNSIEDQAYWVNRYESELVSYIPRDSDLGIHMAKAYIAQAKHFLCSNSNQYLSKAEQLASWPVDPPTFFAFYAAGNRFVEAYDVFSKTDDKSKFDKKLMKKIAFWQSNKGENLYDQGSELGKTEESPRVYKFYKDSLKAKKAALKLMPTNPDYFHEVNVHRRLLAQLLFSPLTNPQTSHALNLDRAIHKLRKSINPSSEAKAEKEFLTEALITALEKRALLAVENCLTNTGEYLSASKEQKKTCSTHINKAKECLTECLSLVDENVKPQLTGKLHFILGDLIRYFELGDYASHFEKAAQCVPNNPYYGVYYKLECLEYSRQDMEQEQVWEMFPTGKAGRYFDWKEERWEKNKIKSGDIDIHSYQPQPKSVFRSMLGF